MVGWDFTQCDGELIECKVYAYRLSKLRKDREKLTYLVSLQKYLKSCGSKARVVIASFENDYKLQQEFSNIKDIIALVGFQKLLYIDNRRCG